MGDFTGRDQGGTNRRWNSIAWGVGGAPGQDGYLDVGVCFGAGGFNLSRFRDRGGLVKRPHGIVPLVAARPVWLVLLAAGLWGDNIQASHLKSHVSVHQSCLYFFLDGEIAAKLRPRL